MVKGMEQCEIKKSIWQMGWLCMITSSREKMSKTDQSAWSPSCQVYTVRVTGHGKGKGQRSWCSQFANYTAASMDQRRAKAAKAVIC